MISYGYPVKEHRDPIVDIVEAANRSFSECLQPGAFMVDTIPLRESCFLRQPTLGVLIVFTFLSSNPYPQSMRNSGTSPLPLHVFIRQSVSAIRAGLVPWNWVESESQGVRGFNDQDGRNTLPICKGSDGESAFVSPMG